MTTRLKIQYQWAPEGVDATEIREPPCTYCKYWDPCYLAGPTKKTHGTGWPRLCHHPEGQCRDFSCFCGKTVPLQED